MKKSRTTDPENAVELVQIPSWKKLGWFDYAFSTRAGGISTVYRRASNGCVCGDLNLGFNSSDSEANVIENRRLFVAAVSGGGRQPPTLVTLRQVHSTLVRRVGREPENTGSSGAESAGDGLMSDAPGVLLGIHTADCIPVLIADSKHRAVAALHAGWRGTVGRIVENGVERMKAEFGSAPEDLVAAIGPGIGKCCYAVGEDVLKQFRSQFLYANDLFREVCGPDPILEAPGHGGIRPALHLDLKEANRRQLLAAGLRSESIAVVEDCTSCLPERYFSHRGEHGFTGRMMSVIGVRARKA